MEWRYTQPARLFMYRLINSVSISALAIRSLDYLHLKAAHAKPVEPVGCQIATTTRSRRRNS